MPEEGIRSLDSQVAVSCLVWLQENKPWLFCFLKNSQCS